MHRSKVARAFTLIELLVVIAIIAILAAILFPVFAQARESARTISCLSNMKQLNLGVQMYIQDYDERLPMFFYNLAPGDPNIGKTDPFGGLYTDTIHGWETVCQPYIKNKQVLFCPSANSPGNDYNNPSKNDTQWSGNLNYAINCEITGRVNWMNPNKLASLSYPATTILISEAGTQTGEGACEGLNGDEWGWMGDHKSNLYQEGATGDTKYAPLRRHKNGANYAFTDGHAKWYSAGSVGWQDPRPSDSFLDTKLSKLMPNPANGAGPNYYPN